MSGPLRSKQGCWTCRLRKKKCDEGRPDCSTCKTLSITCHGYGNKPEWMDNGENEKAMANSIKQIVKHTSRRRGAGRLGTLAARLKQSGIHSVDTWPRTTRLAPKKATGFPGELSPAASSSSAPSESRQSTQKQKEKSSDLSDHGSVDNYALSTLATSGNEPILLMHFLDVVFYLQFPLYKPGIAEGGRGWVYSLLLRTKPLYHAALALSAYHRDAILLAHQKDGSRSVSLVEQEHHLAICLKEFQNSINHIAYYLEKTPGNCLATISCIVQLVFFELFASNGNSWKIHLDAAIRFIRDAYNKEDSPAAIHIDVTIHPNVSNPEDIVMFRFFGGAVIWLDIISSITSGKASEIQTFCNFASAPQSHIDLEGIMGCSNSIMIQVGRISTLHYTKILAIRQGQLDDLCISNEAESIKNEIVDTITVGSIACLSLSGRVPTCYSSSYISPSMIVTRIFALMASVYLHLVLFGFQEENSCLNDSFSIAIDLLQNATPKNILPALVCPLYIFGCVAREKDKQFFRDVFSSAPILDPSLGHRAKILPLIEKIWIIRNNTHITISWQEILELSDDSLLLV